MSEITVSVAGGSGVSVDVTGSTAAADVAVSGATATVSVTQMGGDRGPQGDTGPANTLAIGTVTTGAAGSNASATLTGTAPNQTLSLTIPRGDTGQTGSTGSTGATGSVGPAGPANSLTIGTVTTGAAGSNADATITGAAPNQTLSLTIPRGNTGETGATGAAGQNIELQSTATHLQWRNVGGSTWTNLIALTAITGPQGSTGAAGTNGTNGTNGSNIELQTTSTHVQWRLVGGSTWTDLVALSAITGPQGPATISIGTVTTGAAGSNASVTNSGTSSAVVLDFTIPQGQTGSAGVSWQPVPASPSASGTNGDIAYDASFLYVKSASGWRRTAIATWTPLGAPTGVTAAAGNEQATVSWTAPVDNGGYAITDYAVQFSSNGGSTWTTFADGTSTTTTATVTGLTNGTAYVFRVAAVNGVGTGAYSTASSSVTPGANTDPNFSSVSLLLHMDGSGSTFVDSSGTPKTITANGSATQSTAESKFGGKSAFFNGSSSLSAPASLTNLPAGTDFTVEAWVYPTSTAQGGILGSGGNGPLCFGFDSGKLFLSRANIAEVVASATGAIVANQWQHVAATRSGDVMRLFINGTQVGSVTQSVSFPEPSAFSVGHLAGEGVWYYSGYIDELRITNGVARYTANFTPPTAPFPDA